MRLNAVVLFVQVAPSGADLQVAATTVPNVAIACSSDDVVAVTAPLNGSPFDITIPQGNPRGLPQFCAAET